MATIVQFMEAYPISFGIIALIIFAIIMSIGRVAVYEEGIWLIAFIGGVVLFLLLFVMLYEYTGGYKFA